MSAPVMSPNALIITLVALAWLLVLGIPLLVTFCKRQVKSCPIRFARGGEVPPQSHEGVRVKLSDGWQEFQAFCQCPKCGEHDLHTLDHPSDYEPVLVNEHTFRMWGGQAVTLNHLEYDREDERDWEIARVCRSCKHRWGQR